MFPEMQTVSDDIAVDVSWSPHSLIKLLNSPLVQGFVILRESKGPWIKASLVSTSKIRRCLKKKNWFLLKTIGKGETSTKKHITPSK
uniref:Uncharacterized protein n=1 Tax=Lepeophtheirus salmonis TaxID=72036 RepID=A0A0K2US73_LEPSM